MIGRSGGGTTHGSGGGWSDPGAASTAPGDAPALPGRHPFRVIDDDRYQRFEVVGRGGMGQITIAHDRRLGRDVALKQIAAPIDAPGLASRLAREARVTAVLEHPSIVPVYDAGVGPDGRLYYTMRLIQGRSLAEVIGEQVQRGERTRLIRPFLAVCEAVGYAHSQGVVHRDLKPANVMLGGFGETQVVDWGLAACTDRAPPHLRDEASASEEGDVVGTPGYMSPEQASGAAADPRADVWSLGVILRELATGRREPSAEPVPPELAAIVAKATAATPGERYPDGGAMAAEVARFLDGRRVEAHAYSTIELAARLIRRLRFPLALAAAVLVVAATALQLSFRGIQRERGRAELALAESSRTNGRLLAQRAMIELERGAIPEAGVLAAHALAHEDSADARGVAAAALASPHPLHAQVTELPGCAHVVPGSWEIALCREGDRLEGWRLDPPARLWRVGMAARQVGVVRTTAGRALVVAVDETSAVAVLDAASGAMVHRHALSVVTGYADRLALAPVGDHAAITDSMVLNLVDLRAPGGVVVARPCPGSSLVAIAAGAAMIAVVCGDGRTRLVDAATAAIRAGPQVPAPAELRPYAAALSDDGRRLAVGGLSGRLVQGEVDAAQLEPALASDGAVARLAYLPGSSSRLLVGSERSGATLIDLHAGTVLLRLPDGPSRTFAVTREGVVAGGRQAGRWRIDDGLRPRVLRATAGLASVAATPDHRWIAASRGDGRVSVWRGDSGALVAELPLGASVVKAVAFSAAGDRLAASTGGPRGAPSVWQVGGWDPIALTTEIDASRRLAYLADGSLVAARYADGPVVWTPDGVRHELAGPQMIDLATTPDHRRAILLATSGTVFTIDDGRLRALLDDVGADGVIGWAGGRVLATSHMTSIHVHDGASPPLRLTCDARILDLAITADERHLLAALADGTVAVFRLADQRRVAVLRGHAQRASSVVVDRGGVALAAGWDGAVIAWDLRALDMPAAALIGVLEARWGLTLGSLLDRVPP